MVVSIHQRYFSERGEFLDIKDKLEHIILGTLSGYNILIKGNGGQTSWLEEGFSKYYSFRNGGQSEGTIVLSEVYSKNEKLGDSGRIIFSLILPDEQKKLSYLFRKKLQGLEFKTHPKTGHKRRRR